MLSPLVLNLMKYVLSTLFANKRLHPTSDKSRTCRYQSRKRSPRTELLFMVQSAFISTLRLLNIKINHTIFLYIYQHKHGHRKPY